MRQSLRNAFKKSSAKTKRRFVARLGQPVAHGLGEQARNCRCGAGSTTAQELSLFHPLNSSAAASSSARWNSGTRPANRRNGPTATRRREARLAASRDFRRVIRRHEIHVGAARHHDRPGSDRLQRAVEVAAIDLIVADVAVLPRPDLGNRDRSRPISGDPPPSRARNPQRGEAELAIERIAKKRVRISPGGIDAAEGSQALFGRLT